MKLTKTQILPVTGLIALGILIGLIVSSNLHWTPQTEAANPPLFSAPETEAQSPVPAFSPENTGHSFSSVSKKLLPTVVSISTTKRVKRTGGESPFGPMLREFFGREFKMPESQPLEGLGSGVIVSAEGYILTNNHVVEGADDIKVGLYDKRQFEGKIVATDPLTEVAVIKIEGDDLPVARLGDSEAMEIGDWVLAIGNPLGLSSTVTAGIISALHRDINIIQDGYALENFIQTDAAINPGNSGGALVNLNGEVIGINTAIATRTGGYQGYGFAVPINLAKRIMQDLIKQGYVTRAWLGISMQTVSENMALRYGMEKIRGAIIQEVLEDSPAEKAGFEKLDVIVSIDGKDIDNAGKVQSIVAMKNPGDKITVGILRDGKSKEITVELGQRETGNEEETVVASSGDELPDIGITVQNVTADIKAQYEFLKDAKGALITRVERYSAAAEAGIARGDLIYKIEDITVKSVSDYKKAIKKFDKGQVVIFHVKRQEDTFSAFVKIPE